MKENPDTPVIQMDSVEGRKNDNVLFTIHFVNTSFMLAFIREHNDSQSISEFSNPTGIAFDMETGERRTKIFYCHPSSPFEKGSCKVNHELLRRILPKGTSFDDLTQDDINIIISHINL